MTNLHDQYAFREELVEALKRDVLGPTTSDETLDEGPLDRYVTGILYPADVAGTDDEPDDPDAAEAGGKPDGSYDPGVALSRMKHPSSVGISFTVDPSVTGEVVVTAGAGRYEPLPGEVITDEPTVHSRARRPRTTSPWKRIPIGPVPIPLPVTRPGLVKEDVDEGLELYCVVRPAQDDGRVPVTVVLRNRRSAQRGEQRDAYCFLQPTITASGPPGTFVDRHRERTVAVDDDDLRSYDLLFRDVRTYAVGHGCAADWDVTAEAVSSVSTTYLPSHELPLATPRDLDSVDLDMTRLATCPDEDLLGTLRRLVAEYRTWIAGERRKAHSLALSAALLHTAERHLDDAEVVAGRISSGIDLLADEPDALLAFRLMNEAMQAQRDRQDWIRAGSDGEQPPRRAQTWRPFQLAFILLSLRGIADPDHEDREKADLLWFPTGGGKTEAYLGLIAFTVLLRRLRNPREAGVSALMRYTLRLLTIQQFERAASLICAVERLRSDREELVRTPPVTLGLWVGQGATPNKVADARRALSKLQSGHRVEEGNPVQLTRCPWCGTDLNADDYRIRRSGRDQSLVVSCRNSSCDFASGLPVHLVDEDVYRERPSLLIGTVDKFAMLAWREEAGNIFGADGIGLPPDLIVQDELHLISGPLGTMVGLYEAAVDAACARRHRPKVVASTATIRRAKAQMRAVFDRESAQFPPPGLTVGDTFFSAEADRDVKGTRRYVGLMAPGTSHTTLMVRTFAALLQAAQDLPGADHTRDPYWTLVGYFNSLRVLGGAFMQVIDDVPDRMRLLAHRGNVAERDPGTPMELTSRTSSSEIPDHLARLARSIPDPDSPGVVLATNMISVGVDVDRLGLMAVMGQPQATAEYIQATSRVGRKHPGIVVAMYNSARSRDRSHYEDFLAYHQALYRQVEATSATPYAARARDRGLHGVLVALARLLERRASSDSAAARVTDFATALHTISADLVERAARTDPDAELATERQLEQLIDTWVDAARTNSGLRYGIPAPPVAGRSTSSRQDSLLVTADSALTDPDVQPGTHETPWPTLTSLRDVDATSSLYLIRNQEWNPS